MYYCFYYNRCFILDMILIFLSLHSLSFSSSTTFFVCVSNMVIKAISWVLLIWFLALCLMLCICASYRWSASSIFLVIVELILSFSSFFISSLLRAATNFSFSFCKKLCLWSSRALRRDSARVSLWKITVSLFYRILMFVTFLPKCLFYHHNYSRLLLLLKILSCLSISSSAINKKLYRYIYNYVYILLCS